MYRWGVQMKNICFAQICFKEHLNEFHADWSNWRQIWRQTLSVDTVLCFGAVPCLTLASLSHRYRFNYRSTHHLTTNGFYEFLNWFDERAWYPLGRIVGGTVSFFFFLILCVCLCFRGRVRDCASGCTSFFRRAYSSRVALLRWLFLKLILVTHTHMHTNTLTKHERVAKQLLRGRQAGGRAALTQQIIDQLKNGHTGVTFNTSLHFSSLPCIFLPLSVISVFGCSSAHLSPSATFGQSL